DDDNDDDDTDDEDEEPFEDEDDSEEEEHLAPTDSSATHVVDPIPLAGDTEAFKTDEATPTPEPSPRRHTARISIRPEAPMPFPSKRGGRETSCLTTTTTITTHLTITTLCRG
ncbi:hypothetical protein Tco_0486329, partial [Tanacetum coccineum]